MPVSVSSAGRAAVLARLGDATYGFNAKHAEAAAAHGALPVTVNWSANSKQLFQSFLSPDAIEDTTAIAWPVVCVYAARALNRNRSKYNVFSGEVHIYVDIHLASKSSSAPRAFEIEMDAIEDALIASLNSEPDWGGDDIVYAGDIEFQRLPLTKASANWRQTTRARLTLEIDAN
ncbi:MAG: hypothetical protein EPO02_13055 [Nitrospirae bacterium]|nr:MAG: hypothetical protein EPO02_13055 [Nitrospirota bacterium]